ncbi:MAG: anhydro-N-acetylmuramic acid kinase [Candidatus Methanomethylicia archaeon]|nr:anhydro-N-acetylmuramic acid kinase [Candidatus Methanomethylicia archaeon]
MILNPIEKLCKLRFKEEKIGLGVMSGTSIDGVSIAIAEIRGSWINTKFKIIYNNTYPYDDSIRMEIFKLINPKTGNVKKICQWNYVLGEIFVEKIFQAIKEAGLSISEIDFIASHGQTIYHNPKIVNVYGYKTRSTLQIGEPSIIAYKTRVITIADFRHKDVAAGGQGAPISAYVDYIIFRSTEVSRAIQNIGGIANVTYIPRNAELNDVIAFDVGPGNMIIDSLVREMSNGKMNMDLNGEIAARGEINNELLNYMMKHPYLKMKPPKTTGREDFGEKYVKKIIKKVKELNLCWEDTIATATYYTAKNIIESYIKYLPGKVDEMIIGGGGSRNKTLLKMIKELNQNIKVSLHEDYGIPSQAKEPLLMIILANETINGIPNNIPSATGAKERIIMGKIIVP